MDCDKSKTSEQLIKYMVTEYEEQYSAIQESIAENMSKSLANAKKQMNILLNSSSVDLVEQEKNISKLLQKCNSKLVQVVRLTEEFCTYSNPKSLLYTKVSKFSFKDDNPPDHTVLDMSIDSNIEIFPALNSNCQQSITESGDHKFVQFDKIGLTIFDDCRPLKEYSHVGNSSIYTSVVSMVKFESNQLIDVVVCNSSNPSGFHVHMHAFQDQLLEFQKNLQEWYSWYGLQRFSSPPPINCICVAYYESYETYYRAKVMSNLSNGRLLVHFVDYGKDKVVHLNNLRNIDPKFLKFPFQAVLCSLDKIESSTLEKKWSLTEKSQFNEILQGQKLFADFQNNHIYFNKPVKVSLLMHNNGQIFDLVDILIQYGFAIKKGCLPCNERVSACESGENLIPSSKIAQRKEKDIPNPETNVLKNTNSFKPSIPKKVISSPKTKTYKDSVIIRILVPRFSKKFVYGPNGSVIDDIFNSSKIDNINFLHPKEKLQRECVLRIAGKLENCGKAVYSVLKILKEYFVVRRNTLQWETHKGEIEKELGHSLAEKDFVLKFVVAKHFISIVKSSKTEVQEKTGTVIFISEANFEQMKIDGVRERDFVVTVAGPISCCAKALMRILLKVITC